MDKSLESKRKFYTCLCWIFQFCYLGAWAYFLIGFTVRIPDSGLINKIWSSIILFIAGSFYLIPAFSSPMFKYTINRSGAQSLHSVISSLFKVNPNIGYRVECYHTDLKGFEKITHSEKQYFNYKSSRDISGIFKLNTDGIKDNPNKYFIKLQIKLLVYLSKDGTNEKYFKTRDAFYKHNRNRDDEMKTFSVYEIDGLNNYNLVTVGKNPPCCVNRWIYIFFTLIGMIEFYKLYINSISITQQFTIKKMVSSFRNLNDKKYDKQFAKFTPGIEVVGVVEKFNDLNIGAPQPEAENIPENLDPNFQDIIPDPDNQETQLEYPTHDELKIDTHENILKQKLIS